MPTASEIYADAIRGLPSSERLRLAALILDGLAESAAPALDYSDAWTEEDLRDLSEFSVKNADPSDSGDAGLA